MSNHHNVNWENLLPSRTMLIIARFDKTLNQSNYIYTSCRNTFEYPATLLLQCRIIDRKWCIGSVPLSVRSTAHTPTIYLLFSIDDGAAAMLDPYLLLPWHPSFAMLVCWSSIVAHFCQVHFVGGWLSCSSNSLRRWLIHRTSSAGGWFLCCSGWSVS